MAEQTEAERIYKKYRDIKRKRAEIGIFGPEEVCEYCGSISSRSKNNCRKCGAPMKSFIGLFCGVPVYDPYDAACVLRAYA
jgi:predicted amidophosphoribosyltransferase